MKQRLSARLLLTAALSIGLAACATPASSPRDYDVYDVSVLGRKGNDPALAFGELSLNNQLYVADGVTGKVSFRISTPVNERHVVEHKSEGGAQRHQTVEEKLARVDHTNLEVQISKSTGKDGHPAYQIRAVLFRKTDDSQTPQVTEAEFLVAPGADTQIPLGPYTIGVAPRKR